MKTGFTLIHRRAAKRGFTLIELSIVLVIVGLIIGGVTVGRDLIAAATVRSQISQIDSYRLAASTFESKYGYLPGDIPNPTAGKYGFTTRGSFRGEGDGNGIIESNYGDCNTCWEGQSIDGGETGMFWVDLTKAQLLDANFSTASPTVVPASFGLSTLSSYFPAARIGRNDYVYVWSGGPFYNGYGGGSATAPNGLTYFAVSGMTGTLNNGICLGCPVGVAGITAAEAYGIDKKLDDGLPQSGAVTAMTSANVAGYWGQWWGDSNSGQSVPYTGATQGSASTCYDNGNVAGATENYSMGQNNGAGITCNLSFQLQ